MEQLPEDCIGHIFSFSSPLELGRMSSVSRAAQTTMNSDTTWEKFLPSDYKEIISRLVHPIEFSTKKELFLKLCSLLLIDNGTKMFWLDKRAGKKCYFLGTRELTIAGSNDPLQWTWRRMTGSCFDEVAQLRAAWLLEVQGSIKTSALSPKTTYQVYLVCQITNQAYGLHKLLSEMTIEIGKRTVQKTSMYLCKICNGESNGSLVEQVCDSSRRERYFAFGNDEGQGHNEIRTSKNGMMEIELGKFYNNGDDDEDVRMSLRDVKGVHLKGGFIVQGIEIKAQI